MELTPVVKGQNLGIVISEQEFDFGGNAHGPDISFISASKVHLLDRQKRVQRFVPDLAIEIGSENDTFKGLMGKAARYRTHGTREVWMLSPDTRNAFVLLDERQVMVDDDRVFESKMLPGFAIRLSELFDRF